MGCESEVKLLVRALAESRALLERGAIRSRGGEQRAIDACLRSLRDGVPGDVEALAERLVRADADRAALGDVLGLAARRLAPDGAAPDGAAPAGEAWRALVLAVDRLYGAGAHPLGRLAFVGDAILGLLREEAAGEEPAELPARRATGRPGRVLASLAVSRKLAAAVGAAVGFDVAPTYDALYLYDPPGSHVRTHVDARDAEIVFHLILAHDRPSSALVVHEPATPGGRRIALLPGEGVALRGRGTIHCWEPLRDDERRTLVTIGFGRAG